MKKISTIAVSQFHLASHVAFHASVNRAMEEGGFSNAKWDGLLSQYSDSIAVLSDIVRRQQGSVYTEDVQAADARRDSTMRQIFLTVDAAAKSTVSDEKEAGKKLQFILKPYRKDTRDQMSDQTEDVRGMVQVLRGETASPLVGLLMIQAFIDRLEQQNEQFDTLYRERAVDRGAQPCAGVDTVAQRKMTDTLYTNLTEMLNSLSVAAEAGIETGFDTDTLNTLIDTVNAYIAQYKLVLANQAKKTAAPPSPPEGGDV